MLHEVSNALVESTKMKLRVFHRMVLGIRDPEHLIASHFRTAAATAPAARSLSPALTPLS